MASCRDCRYYKTDVDLPHPVCTYNEFHFTNDYTPCESFSPSSSYSSSSYSSSSGSGSKMFGVIIGIAIAVIIAIFAVTNLFASKSPGSDNQENTSENVQSETTTSEYFIVAYVKSSSGLRLRKGPSTNDEKILTMENGAELNVLKSESGWAYVKYNGEIEGWCSEEYLEYAE